MIPLKSILIESIIENADNIRMIISNNMDISIYHKLAQSSNAYIFNILNVANRVNLADDESYKWR